ncbi:hypothetical protein Amsp01_097560 [Amycolatopsis sp. NBRC 101858]|uniref:hypothetical protein n=1 Tax=Amycolatopsis sp. NBRC 101858 TaxID=3032200 RepID=UPI0024A3D272|nr:hypothetical protein [Amycolatopsis sp. NBRC 101858]GLY43733.1 hypothetical protein Amsp01_097560 [Amycolatopsis sp. NBRC 101858]
MLNPELFVDDAHVRRLNLLAEQVTEQLRIAGFAVPSDPTAAGGVEVEVKKVRYAPGVFLFWYVHPSWSRQVVERADEADGLRFLAVKDVMEEALVKVLQAVGFTAHHHEYRDWSGWEVRDPAEEEETP